MQQESKLAAFLELPPSSARAWDHLRTYAQLVRFPNIFTAQADISLGWFAALATGTAWGRWPAFVLLLAASSCLYAAGMVWNDFFDFEQDRRERPFRPLPSGRVTRGAAARLGIALLAGGLILVQLAAPGSGSGYWDTVCIALCLVVGILVYDVWLKRTWLGPVAMGACRFLNVLLGLSIAEEGSLPWYARLYLAGVVGIYIVGVTWFARTEARRSQRTPLALATGTMLAALVLALAVPVVVNAGNCSPFFPYLLVGLGFAVGIPAGRALDDPSPARVQVTVKRAIFGLVVLDALLASALIGTIGLTILLLLVPALFLGRWIYST